MITLPNFSEHETIIPNITWTGSSMVNNDGSTNRPTFSESPLEEYKSTTVTAQLSHPTTPTVFLEKTYTI